MTDTERQKTLNKTQQVFKHLTVSRVKVVSQELDGTWRYLYPDTWTLQDKREEERE